MDIERIKSLQPFWGSWYIKRKLGEGGFGAVFEIERREYDCVFQAALKVVSIPSNETDLKEALASGMTEEETSDYFEDIVRDMTKEFVLMESVKGHTNIVDYEDHIIVKHRDSIGWDILIRMELLIPLNDYILHNELSLEEICRLGIDICTALSVCERKAIIHRDIKPGNIFMTQYGEFKLGDFGIARVSDKTKGASTKIGTKDYVAPEVYKGERYGKTVDLYSLGIVLYRLINHGRLPFLPPTSQKVTYQDKEVAFEKRIMGAEKIEKPSDCPDLLFAILEKACAYRPQDRYTNADEMKEDLQRFLLSLSNKSQVKQNKSSEKFETVEESDLPKEEGEEFEGVYFEDENLEDENYEEELSPLYDENQEEVESDNGEDEKMRMIALIALILLLVFVIFGFTARGQEINTENLITAIGFISVL